MKACQTVHCFGVAQRCDREAVPLKAAECLEKPTTLTRRVCAQMPTEIEALAALDDLVDGHCSSVDLKNCSCMAEGKPSVSEIIPLGDIVDGLWAKFVNWMRTLGGPAKPSNRDYPIPPLRQR